MFTLNHLETGARRKEGKMFSLNHLETAAQR
jgi:hypothetical protein